MPNYVADYENAAQFRGSNKLRAWRFDYESLADEDVIILPELAEIGGERAVYITATDATTYTYEARALGLNVPYALGGSTEDQSGAGGGALDNTVDNFRIVIKSADTTTAGTTDRMSVVLLAYT